MVRVALLLGLALPVFGQISVGIIGGVPFNDLTSSVSSGSITTKDDSGRFTIGPTIRVSLPLGFRVEADALYRGAGLNVNASVPNVVGSQNYSASQWRFPVLLQYRLSAPVVKPFLEAGYSYDHIDIKPQVSVLGNTPASSISITSHHGFVIGAGLDLKVPFLKISPELRYTRDAGPDKALNGNQAEFLVGIRF
jgi:hypothetical protein